LERQKSLPDHPDDLLPGETLDSRLLPDIEEGSGSRLRTKDTIPKIRNELFPEKELRDLSVPISTFMRL